MSGVLVAGTIGSASPRVDPAAKADALALVPFLRPCLTRRAADYGHSRSGPSSCVPEGAAGEGHDCKVLPALEEMIARHFPIEDSREPAEGSEEATAFALLLRGLLSVFVRCEKSILITL